MLDNLAKLNNYWRVSRKRLPIIIMFIGSLYSHQNQCDKKLQLSKTLCIALKSHIEGEEKLLLESISILLRYLVYWYLSTSNNTTFCSIFNTYMK